MSIEHERGSGNVFADLGLPNADELLAKAKIVGQISDLIEARRLTQTDAAETLGIDQPSLSRLLRGRTSGFSMDRLIRMLNAFDCDVTITVSPKPATRDHAHVIVQPFSLSAPTHQ
ncbi:MAG: helix-turn-helix domain-containing protein [Chloroflexota bacterium]|nr:helix-turn-helix domain-containing protein [Chloroflexota bacterium]